MLKDAREAAGLSQEEAAYRLHIGRRTLSDYENGKTIATAEVVDAMARAYKQPLLRYMYCHECPLGSIHDQVGEVDFSTAVLGFMSEHKKTDGLLDELMDIAADGKVTKDEIERVSALDAAMRMLRQKITTVQLAVASQMTV